MSRGNYTHDASREEEIHRGNAHLLERLHSIATHSAASGIPRPSSTAAGPRLSSHTVNRKKKEAEIERQNMLLLKKLQSAKTTLKKDARVGSAATGRGSGLSSSSTARAASAAGTSRPSAAAGGAGAAYGATSTIVGRPAWQDPTSKTHFTTSAEYDAMRGGGGGGGGGPSSPVANTTAAKKSVFGRASLGGTARIGGKMTGLPVTRGEEPDYRDLLLSACPERHLTK